MNVELVNFCYANELDRSISELGGPRHDPAFLLFTRTYWDGELYIIQSLDVQKSVKWLEFRPISLSCYTNPTIAEFYIAHIYEVFEYLKYDESVVFDIIPWDEGIIVFCHNRLRLSLHILLSL